MKLLLDTHTLLWWWSDNPSLSRIAREAIAEPETIIWMSAASAWEIATKQRLGKLPAAPDVQQHFFARSLHDGFSILPIDHRHALRGGAFAVDHRDPFDRLLAAQAEIEDATLVTRDPAFALFPVQTLW